VHLDGVTHTTGPLALMWSGGKDSCLALLRAQSGGLPVTTLVSIVDAATERVRFHATRRALLEAQARSLGLALDVAVTAPERYEHTFRRALHALAARGLSGVVFGNIHLADVRAWFEERVRAEGLAHVEPLWEQPPLALLREFIASGHRAVVTCREEAKLDPTWLGREVDATFADDIAALPGVDPCGERGEYHTFVFAGPLLRAPVRFRAGERHREAGFEQLDLVPEVDG
jgi:uncharacterized protein (TIGR00290 family)